MDPQVQDIMGIDLVDAQFEVMERYFSVGTGNAFQSQAKDVFGREERRFDGELSEERFALFKGVFQPEIGNLLGGGMNLVIVVALYFLFKDFFGWSNFIDILPDTGSDQMILQPTVRAFNFPFGLRRKSIRDSDGAIFQNLFPLRVYVISKGVVVPVCGVPTFDIAEDGMGIDIIGEGRAVLEKEFFQGYDMRPGCFLVDQAGIEDEAAVIIQ